MHPDYPYPENCVTDEQKRIWDEYIESWLAVGRMNDLIENIFKDD